MKEFSYSNKTIVLSDRQLKEVLAISRLCRCDDCFCCVVAALERATIRWASSHSVGGRKPHETETPE